MTITEFLEARINDDEREALDAPKMSDVYDVHRAAFTPALRARVLADCVAKRAIIAEHADFVAAIDMLSAALPGDLNQDPDAPFRTGVYRHLAAVYKDHPDYQQEWAL